MRINPSNNPAVQGTTGADVAGTDSTKRSERLKKSGYEGSAQVDAARERPSTSSASISPKAKEMARAAQLAKDSPDVREAKIAELREKIQNKTYSVSANDIADRLVDDHIRMAGV